jgi:SAM-dependent methyltransferase
MNRQVTGSPSREREFHDRWAEQIDVAAIEVLKQFEGSTAPENRFIVGELGDVRGKLLLDLGCGAGENSVYFAGRGARCVAADYSPGMVERALELARHWDVSIEGRVVDAMDIDYPDGTFDIVYAANLLHHVEPERALREIHRVLKPGGRACAWDPLRHNPLINLYRRMATEVRSVDERPLDIRIVRFTESLFAHVTWDVFWLATLWIFVRFYLIERVDPNRERYWKKIIVEEERLRATYRRLESWDRALKRLPGLRRLAWNLAFVATKR